MHALSLVVVAGPDTGRRVTVDGATSVGRGQGERLQLTDTAVSRHHLTISIAGDDGNARAGAEGSRDEGLVVSELSGVNPVWTLIDGQRVDIAVGHRLSPGATFTLGNTTVRVESGTRAPSRSTVEIDANLAEAEGGPDHLASLAALADRLARCGSLQAVYREATTWAVQALGAARALLLSPDGKIGRAHV